MKRVFAILFLSISVLQLALAQADISGRVLDSNREPLPGASVLVKGTSIGVATDFNGRFTLKAEPGQILEISYVGYVRQDLDVTKSGYFEIVMEEVPDILDEIVVVGVSMKKSDLTGAVSYIDSGVLKEKPVTNINDALAGRVAGVSIIKGTSPSEDSSIKIRGTNTINSGSSPIYVVDGLVMGNDFGFFNTINVNDVESIQILKDASATALYGSRGANGVIVVTTKKAKKNSGAVNYDG